MMTRSEVERLLAEEIAKTVVPLQHALEQAKRTIAMLQTTLYGVRRRPVRWC